MPMSMSQKSDEILIKSNGNVKASLPWTPLAHSGRPILEGIRILDLTSVIFGPFCTSILASMGAEILKVEPPRGDEIRRVGKPRRNRGMGPTHLTLNAGKQAYCFDIRSPEGQERLQAMLDGCHVLIHNLRPEAARRAKLAAEDLTAQRPDLVHLSCAGYDSRGPRSGQPAYDDVIQAASGAASLLPAVDGDPRPRYLPMAMADKVAALYAANAVLAALARRTATGIGGAVEVPMFEAFTHFLLQDHLYGGVLPDGPEKLGYPRQLDPQRQPLKTRDGYIAVAPYTDDRWVHFFKISGAPQFLAENGLDDARSRFAALDLMQAKMAQLIATRDSAAWIALLEAEDIPCARVARLEQLFEDPQLQASGFFRERQHPQEGRYREMALPIHFANHPEAPRFPARLLGEDNPL